MKTLVNKNNPQIRISAPEIEKNQYQYTVNVGKLQPLIFLLPEWTLVEEEPVDLEKEIKEWEVSQRANSVKCLSIQRRERFILSHQRPGGGGTMDFPIRTRTFLQTWKQFNK